MKKKLSHWLGDSIRKCRHWRSPFIVEKMIVNENRMKNAIELFDWTNDVAAFDYYLQIEHILGKFVYCNHAFDIFFTFSVNWTLNAGNITLWLHTPNNGRKQSTSDGRRATSVEWSIASSSICDLVENEHKITIKGNQSQDQLWLPNHIFSNSFLMICCCKSSWSKGQKSILFINEMKSEWICTEVI